jgi:hypothetical protein
MGNRSRGEYERSQGWIWSKYFMYIYENRIRKSIENYLKLGKGVRKVTRRIWSKYIKHILEISQWNPPLQLIYANKNFKCKNVKLEERGIQMWKHFKFIVAWYG